MMIPLAIAVCIREVRMKPLVLNSYYSQVIVVYQVHHGCTKIVGFIKSKHFSYSAFSILTGADVRRQWGGGTKIVLYGRRLYVMKRDVK